MTTFVANLATLSLSAAEKAAVAAAVGYEDAQGMVAGISLDLQLIITKLQRLATYVPAGANLTAINNAIASLQT